MHKHIWEYAIYDKVLDENLSIQNDSIEWKILLVDDERFQLINLHVLGVTGSREQRISKLLHKFIGLMIGWIDFCKVIAH